MRKSRLTAYALLTSFLFSCSDIGMSGRLEEIESLMPSRPDSALTVIRAIDTTRLRGASQKARYSLLLSMALAKNDIDTSDVSISAPAVEFYSRHGSRHDRMKAVFYRGQQQYNGSRYYAAAVSYLKALDYAIQLEDLEYQGLSNGSLSEVYSATYNYYEALSYLDDAIDCFHSNDDSRRLNLAVCRKARLLGNMYRFDEADSLYESLLGSGGISPQLHRTVLSYYAHSLAARPDPDYQKAGELYREALASGGGLESGSDWGAYACCLSAGGDTKRADSIMKQLEQLPGSENYAFWKARILELRGQYKAAIECRNTILSADRVRKVFSQSAAIGQRDYFRLQAESSAKESRAQRILTFTISLAFLLAGLLAWTIFDRQRRKNREERERLLNLAETARRELHDIRFDKNASERQIESLRAGYLKIYKAQFTQLGELYELVRAEEMKAGKKSAAPAERVYDRIKNILKDINSDEDGQARFEAVINSKMGDVMAHFREDFPMMDFEDYKFISCVFAGFDGITLAQIFDSTPASVRMKKSRLKKKIESTSCLRKDEYLRLF